MTAAAAPRFEVSHMAKTRFGERANHLAGDTSSAWAVQDEALARAAAGEQIIFLTVGDPDQATPTAIIELAIGSLRRGRTHYSPVPGEPALRAAVAQKLSRESGRAAAADEIVIFPGAQSALFAVASLLVGPGDEIIVAEPYYATYPGVIAATGACLVPAPAASEKDFAFDVQAVLARVTPRTKAVLLSNPANPTGATVDVEDLRTLADFSRRHDVWLIADEVYSNLVFESDHSCAWPHGDPQWTVVLNSMSKTYAMTGWRLGWAAAPPDLTRHLTNFAAAAQFGCTQFIQDAATEVLNREVPEVAAMRGEYRRRRDYVVKRANAIEGVRAVSPQGGMFVMLDIRAIEADDVSFAFALLRSAKVALVPGSGFGASAQGHVRISLSQPIHVLEAAFDAIGEFVSQNLNR